MSAASDAQETALEEPLRVILAPRFGAVEIVGLSRLKGGYSREMWAFDLLSPDGASIPLILCADSVAGVVGSDAQALDRVLEAGLLHHLHALGLPVPDALASGDAESALGRPFFVMERLPGTAAVASFRRDPWYLDHLEDLGGQLAGILAGIHGVHLPDAVLGERPDPSVVADGAVVRWTAELRATPEAVTPTIERALDWLATHRPAPPAEVVVVHGDFRIGNVLHGRGGDRPDGLWTVLDWEMAHHGDPIEDVAWAQLVCWQVGTGKVGGLVAPDRWVQLYEEASGRRVDATDLRFWEVLATVKMTCLIWRAAQVVPEGRERALLERLFVDLEAELDRRLLVDDGFDLPGGDRPVPLHPDPERLR